MQTNGTSSNFNFSAGPAVLPQEVTDRAKKELWDWYAPGISAMEISHRSKPFTSVIEANEKMIRQLLHVDDRFRVLFLQGGATAQFFNWCANLMDKRDIADFLITGHWSHIAHKEAARFCQETNVALDCKSNGYTTIPPSSHWQTHSKSRYLHYADNETVHGIEFTCAPHISQKLLVSDMSSNILTRPIDLDSFACLYAGTQKNIGISGLTLVIVREDVIKDAPKNVSSLLSYQVQSDSGSMPNTPPTITHYLLSLCLEWTIEKGGVASMQKRCAERCQEIYNVIDNSNGFYSNPVDTNYRSRVNIVFDTPSITLNDAFCSFTQEQGLHFLKGHRARGGIRASIYNAMSDEGVARLLDCMKSFLQKN